ncbi:hypothetical protein [Streptomyces sp. SGAir0924]|uniref:hypothetical protein n=1 Tax=Streptomyces sp. SGAir0924 TaxID=2109593 RepID=UPI0010CD267C|nr:hypothetical protein [Streptomyces sp. SGAir0924]QCR49841.1 hypothetical protein C1N79_26300 [Streptomyces sp. SGAir0924]
MTDQPAEIRLRLAHQARRAKEHQLDDIRRALCDIGFMEDDDPYSHADLAEVIRQNGRLLEVGEAGGADAVDPAAPAPAATAPDDEYDGPLIPPTLTEAIRQYDAETERAVAVLAQAYGPMADLDHPQHPINVEKTARVFAALHRSAEDTITRVIALHEQWVKAGPPPLGTPVTRWWDARLVELHDAIQPADQITEK